MLFWLIVLAIIGGVIYKYCCCSCCKKEPKLLKTDFKKDVVYLYQFKRSVHVPNPSPFCMKVETFLRANKIDYEVVEGNLTRSHKGLLPFIELNGRQIADSEFIVYALAEKFGVKENLEKERAAALHTLARLYDEEVFRLQLTFKAKCRKFLEILLVDYPSFLVPLAFPIFKFVVKRRLNATGYGAHSDEDILQLYRRDLQAAADLLGDRKFYGDDKITIADCAVFGQLASVYLLPFDSPAHTMISKEFPVLEKYIKSIIQQYYSDFPCAKRI